MNRESIKSICVGKDVFFRSNIVPQVYVHSYISDEGPYVEILDESRMHMTEFMTLKKTRNIFDVLFALIRFILPIVFLIIGAKDRSFQFLTFGIFMILPQFTTGWEFLHKVINIVFRRKLILSEYRLKDTLSTFEMLFDKRLRMPTYDDVKAAPPSDSYTRDIDGMFYLITFVLVALDIFLVYPNMERFWTVLIATFAFTMALSYCGCYDNFQKKIYQAPSEESFYQVLACMKAWIELEEDFKRMEREQGYIAIVFEEPAEDSEADNSTSETDANKPKS
mgnify:CR=1 FL=1